MRAMRPEFNAGAELFLTPVADPARELLAREGDRVQAGQLLVRLTWKEPELEGKSQQAYAELAEAVAPRAGLQDDPPLPTRVAPARSVPPMSS